MLQLCPEWQQTLFPRDATQTTRDSQSYLFPASQLGLALYMFVVGMEFRVDIVRQHFRSSVVVSVAGMLAPFALGAVLAWFFVRHTKLFPPQTSPFEAMLFLGASLCITAFPMLARLIHSKGLTGTRMGTVAIGAGAIDDAVAWCVLALVLASFDGDFRAAAESIGGGLTFVAVGVGVILPILRFSQQFVVDASGSLSEAGLVLGLVCMVSGAWFTDLIRLHAVFGAFVMGAVVPRGIMHRELIERIQPLAVGLLLPLFLSIPG